jgi:hypothetical protein
LAESEVKGGGWITVAVALLGVVVLGAVELRHAHEDELVVLGVVRLRAAHGVTGERELRRRRRRRRRRRARAAGRWDAAGGAALAASWQRRCAALSKRRSGEGQARRIGIGCWMD